MAPVRNFVGLKRGFPDGWCRKQWACRPPKTNSSSLWSFSWQQVSFQAIMKHLIVTFNTVIINQNQHYNIFTGKEPKRPKLGRSPKLEGRQTPHPSSGFLGRCFRPANRSTWRRWCKRRGSKFRTGWYRRMWFLFAFCRGSRDLRSRLCTCLCSCNPLCRCSIRLLGLDCFRRMTWNKTGTPLGTGQRTALVYYVFNSICKIKGVLKMYNVRSILKHEEFFPLDH